MAVFDDVRLPEDVEVGAQGGPMFQTTIVALASGGEQRNQDWSEQRCEFDVGYGISTVDDLRAVLAFFYARRGRARGFRFRDWTDYQLTNEPIDVGDGVEDEFQIIKTYETSGPHSYGRRITRPVANTLLVYLDGVLKTLTTHYTLGAGGVITFTSPPGNAVVISVSCEFDVPVRFDTDKFNMTLEGFEAGVVPSLPVVELRE
jgi:uncharacterized protein (TIGR02217 family)